MKYTDFAAEKLLVIYEGACPFIDAYDVNGKLSTRYDLRDAFEDNELELTSI